MANEPPRRRPLLSNTLRTLSRIYSLFPEENPFSQSPDSTYTPAVWQAISVPQKSLLIPTTDDVGENSALRNDGNVEVKDMSVHGGADKDENAEVLCEENGFNRSEMIIDELNGVKEAEAVDKVGSNEKGTNDHPVEASNLSQGLLGIETLLMDESDDIDLLHMSDKEGTFDILGDFGSFMIGDELGDGSVLVESTANDQMLGDVSLKEDVVVENKRKDMEDKNSPSGGNAGKFHVHVPTEREKLDSLEVGNLLSGSTPQGVDRREPKVYKRKVRQDKSQTVGLIFSEQRSENDGGTISGVKGVDSIKKGHKSGAVDKKKTKKSKKTDIKDVKSVKSKRVSLDGEGSDRSKYGGVDPLVIGKTQMLSVHGNVENLSSKLVGKCKPTKHEKLKYNREELMHFRESAVPANMLKAVTEINAQLHGENHNPTIQEGTVSVIKEKKKRGTSSEARKEKKKQKRRIKRVEMNRKLGVKRVKLRPILKRKVVSHCRHYLMGRCHEGEKCKFSHDVIPLTKSKPCCHFARNSCMKGDECPYDHELSKYPCNNVVENGFCSRGESCLFSHKVSAEDLEAKANVSKNESCSLDQFDKSKKSVLQPRVANVQSSGFTTMPKNLKENLDVQISNKPTKAPKGLSFLSFGKPQPNVDFSVTNNGQSNLGNSLMTVPTSPTPQGAGFVENLPSPTPQGAGFVDNLPSPTPQGAGFVHNLPSSPTPRGAGFVHNLPSPTPRGVSFLLPERSSTGQPKSIAERRTVQLGKSSIDPPRPAVDFLSPQKASNNASLSPFGSDILHKLQGGHSGSQIENKSVGDSDKLKGVNLETQLKSTPGAAAHKALLSTLAFAAKLESGVRMSEVKKNEGSGSKSMKASAILDLLYGGSKETK